MKISHLSDGLRSDSYPYNFSFQYQNILSFTFLNKNNNTFLVYT